MPILTRSAYIINNGLFSQESCPVQIDCSIFNPVEDGYFVFISNSIPDGCGGYLEIGTRINENQTVGIRIEDGDWIKLLHVESTFASYWIEDTRENYKTACRCTVFNQDWAIAASDKTTPITTLSDQLLFWTTREMTFSEVRASLDQPQATGARFTIDIKLDGVTIFSALLSFNNGEEVTFTSSIPAVMVTKTFPNNSKVTLDITQVGDGTAAGLIIYFVA